MNNKKEMAELLLDFFHRITMHHAMWFSEVKHQMGEEKAFKALDTALTQSRNIQLKRLSKVLGFEMEENIPAPLLNMEEETLTELLDAASINWLANDGVWFQAVEFTDNMFDAKRCNDSCWTQFSPFEAWSIKRLIGLGDQPGLDGLKEALKLRLYAYVNEQSIVDETDSSFVFQMNQCRVQNSRKRKGLDDYPCKSAGMVEYPRFATAIDKRIKTECIGCPPDPHPEEWFCAWKFTLEE